MSDYFIHVTLASGHSVRHSRTAATDAEIEPLKDLLAQLLQGSAPEVPGQPGYYVNGVAQGRNLMATLWAGRPSDRAPILTTGVALKARSAPVLWRTLHQSSFLHLTDPEQPPPAPWIADRIEPAAMLHMDAMSWTGAWSRTLGWAWLAYGR